MVRCPYCFEKIEGQPKKCPHCDQFMIDPPVQYDFPAVDKKKCVYCGRKILTQARFCRFCQKWIDKVEGAADELEDMED